MKKNTTSKKNNNVKMANVEQRKSSNTSDKKYSQDKSNMGNSSCGCNG